jgi:hypothetical protein
LNFFLHNSFKIKFNRIILDLVRLNEKNDSMLEGISELRDGLSYTIKSDNVLLGLDDALVEISNRETRKHLYHDLKDEKRNKNKCLFF